MSFLTRALIGGGIVAFGTQAIIGGVAGNAAYDALKSTVPWLVAAAAAQPVMLSTAGFVAISTAFAIHSYRRRSFLAILARVLELDSSLLRKLPDLAAQGDRKGRLEAVLTDFLRDCVRAFGRDVHRAWILRADGEYLMPWVDHGIARESVARTRFYVGDGAQLPVRRGTAGEVFRTRRHRIVHIHLRAGRWVADDLDYIAFDPDRPNQPYRSFIVAPIEWGDECFGVLCLDSRSLSTFDDRTTQELVSDLATRAAATIVLDRELNARD
ncbi:MAG: GAF domain-containing protein [Chloroflexi bacterium]|nr:GAF domain-containing protein [Chloroflexota bacterium]